MASNARMPRLAQVLLAIVVMCLVLVAAFWAADTYERITGVGYFTRDPTDVAGVPWYAGVLSRLTNLGWIVAATAGILAAQTSTPPRRRPLVLFSGLCAAIALDDTMLIHEEILPSLGVSENILLALYCLAGLMLAWWFWPFLRSAVGVAFFGGAVMLAASIAVDAFLANVVTEDVAKLAGVIAWCFCGFWAHSEVLGSSRRAVSSPQGSSE